MKTEKQKTGKAGEDVACTFLVKHAYEIIERNYLKKWGEIDIVARKEGILHFVEVKTVTHETFRPEDNLHPWKLKRLSRVIQSYLLSKCDEDQTWQFDVVIVYLDMKERTAKCRFMRNIIL